MAEMLEVGLRCGRRKQPNPRRKNEDEDGGPVSELRTKADSISTHSLALPSATIPAQKQSHDTVDNTSAIPIDSYCRSGDEKETDSEDSGTAEMTVLEEEEETSKKNVLEADGTRYHDNNTSVIGEQSDDKEKTMVVTSAFESTEPVTCSKPEEIGPETMIRSEAAIESNVEEIVPESMRKSADDDSKCAHCKESFCKVLHQAPASPDYNSGGDSEDANKSYDSESSPVNNKSYDSESSPEAAAILKLKHTCVQCGISFAHSSQLKKHAMLHVVESQVCSVCSKAFANVYRLQRHMISHEESVELRKFKCPQCVKAFKFKHHLKEHVRIHSGEKPFQCANCGKRFSHSGSYSSHMTSKKCWVVNLKVRHKGDPAVLKLPGDCVVDGGGILRPIIPKGNEVGEGNVELPPGMFPPRMYPPVHFMPSPYQATYLAQLNGGSPFVTPMPFRSGHVLAPVMPYRCGSLPVTTASMKLMLGQKWFPSLVDKSQPPMKTMDATRTPMNGDWRKDVFCKTENVDESSSDVEDDDEVMKENECVRDDGSDCDLEPRTEAVKKVLQIVDATVQQQQRSKEDKTQLSKLVNLDSAAGKNLNVLAFAASEQLEQMVKEECWKEREGLEEKACVPAPQSPGSPLMTCRFCDDRFEGPIRLHQHERYLCPKNTAIQRSSPTARNGTASPSSVGTAERTEDETDDLSDDSFVDRDGRRYRVRSMISEGQQSLLKAQYDDNPHPSKFDVARLAIELGFSKRVVQVWFQNMRARQRRRCRVGTDDVSPSRNVPVTTTPSVKTETEMQNDAPKSRCHLEGIPLRYAPVATSQFEPLDLSVRLSPTPDRDPEQAIDMSSRIPAADDIDPEEGQVLNLSKKKDPEPENGEGGENRSSFFPESAIFKYMQRERLIKADLLDQTMTNVLKTVLAHPSVIAPPPAPPAHHHISPHSIARPIARRPSPIFLPPVSPSVASNGVPSPALSSHESSFNSTVSQDSAGADSGIVTGVVTGATKSRRARKKTWRQVGEHLEADDFQFTFSDDDALGELPPAKKRRSWKNHKVDAIEGFYACDQCDKIFSKQSSLARHKYEHSGQRPFCCEICCKAFKHKHHLTEHRRLHSGEKPFKCGKCGKRFSHSGSYSQHMNHRYKYCKPLMDGETAADEEEEEEEEGFKEEMEEGRNGCALDERLIETWAGRGQCLSDRLTKACD